MQGSYLWTSTWPSIPSCLTFSQKNVHCSLVCPTSICQRIPSFLTDRQQLVRLGKLTTRTLTISAGAPQGCVLSPLLFSLYTNTCTLTDPSVKLLKFADDTTVIGLIKDGDKSAYRQEVEQQAVWCSLNNLELNNLKTVEMIADFTLSLGFAKKFFFYWSYEEFVEILNQWVFVKCEPKSSQLK